jgi:hypothetical protein
MLEVFIGVREPNFNFIEVHTKERQKRRKKESGSNSKVHSLS